MYVVVRNKSAKKPFTPHIMVESMCSRGWCWCRERSNHRGNHLRELLTGQETFPLVSLRLHWRCLFSYIVLVLQPKNRYVIISNSYEIFN